MSQTGGDDQVDEPTSGFDFSTGAPAAKEEDAVEDNVKRVFKLWHISHADKPRTITHIQCVTWPDFDVPQTPNVLMDLMRDVDAAVEDSTECEDDHCSAPPVLVHCSAGIGRTGSYILIDAITDGLRREYKLAHGEKEQTSSLLDASALRITSSPPRPPSSPGGAGSPTGGMDLDSPVKRGASLPNLSSASADSAHQDTDVLAKDAFIHGEAKINEPPSPIHSPLSDPDEPTPMMDLDSPVKNEGEALPDSGASSPVLSEPEILDPNTNVVVNEPEQLSPTKDHSIISREPSMPSLPEHAEDEPTPTA